MDYGRFRCRRCKKLRRKQTANQRYCGQSECQKARKNAWRREKYAQDSDYRANQRDSTDAWLGQHGGSASYHRGYRKRRKDSVTPEAASQPSPLCAAPPETANSDAGLAKGALLSGVYTLIPMPADGGANSDALLVEIAVVPRGHGSITNIDPVALPGAP